MTSKKERMSCKSDDTAKYSYDKEDDIEYQNLLQLKCKRKNDTSLDESIVEEKYTVRKDKLGKSFNYLVIANSVSLIFLILTIYCSTISFFISTHKKNFHVEVNNLQMNLTTYFIFWLILLSNKNYLLNIYIIFTHIN